MLESLPGNYENLEQIGQGGMGTVYRANQPGMDRVVAIKVIHAASSSDPTLVQRFEQEAKLIVRLQHPHLLPVYEYNSHHQPPFIVMRYLEGGTLRDVLTREKRLPPGEVLFTVRQLASALDYAHRQGVIHRDVKPSNVLFDEDGNAYLMDFGLARLTQGGAALTQSGLAIGTPNYMPPEQAMGAGEVDHRADIYSLGVMLFEMFTGRLPFGGESSVAIIMQHIRDSIPRATAYNDELTPEIDHIIEWAMAKAPEDRYQSATELTDALTSVLGAQGFISSPAVLRRTIRAIMDGEPLPDTPAVEPTAAAAPTEVLPPKTTQSDAATPAISTTQSARALITPAITEVDRAELVKRSKTKLPSVEAEPEPAASRSIPLVPVIVVVMLLAIVGGVIFVMSQSNNPAAAPVPATDTPAPTATATITATIEPADTTEPTAAPSNTPDPFAEPVTFYVLGVANVRACTTNTPDCPVLTQFEQPASLQVVGTVDGEPFEGETLWYRVQLDDGQEVFVHSSALSEIPPWEIDTTE
jgi:serine/threonine-protein kinase